MVDGELRGAAGQSDGGRIVRTRERALTGATTIVWAGFEQANGRTILLDEIGEMPTICKRSVARAQGAGVSAIGSSETVKVDLRIVAASNSRLAKRVMQGGSARYILPFECGADRTPPLRERQSISRR